MGHRSDLDLESSLTELEMLADSAGLHTVGLATQNLTKIHPATYIGPGKVDEVRTWLKELNCGIVIFDNELSPRTQRELEVQFGEQVKVLDRTALILDIFAQHARTREGALQVELAQCEYRLPRLTRQWTHLARQVGGGSGRGGAAGVGLRGPGETQLETDRREVRRRIASLRTQLESVRAHRSHYRERRRRGNLRTVSIIGYTNAGKSSLLNRLSGARVFVADKLFATLDPTTRRVQLPGADQIVISDTVGFIQNLPHTLIAAFRATLEEIADSDLLVHVIDCSVPNARARASIVERILTEDLGISGIPIIRALNKVDLLEESDELEESLTLQHDLDALIISAKSGEGMTGLCDTIVAQLEKNYLKVSFRFLYGQGDSFSQLRRVARVIAEHHTDIGVEMTCLIDARYIDLFRANILE